MPGVTVRAGDTLSAIAGRNGVTLAALLAANPQITDKHAIRPGQKINLPGGAAPEAAPAPAAGSAPAGGGLDYVALIQTHGSDAAKADLEAGRVVLLGLRKPSNFKINGGLGAYDDTMVLVRKVGGAFETKTFVCNTEPSARYLIHKPGRKLPPDVNKDGRPDLGQLQCGQTIQYVRGSYTINDVSTPALRADERATAIIGRDLDRDGQVSAHEPKSAVLGAGSMHIHVGGSTMTGSMGCQTLSPREHARLFKALDAAGSQPRYRYVLIQHP